MFEVTKRHLTLSQPSPTLFGRTKLGKTGFPIEAPDLIKIIMEDRLRHAKGPVQFYASVTYMQGIHSTWGDVVGRWLK